MSFLRNHRRTIVLILVDILICAVSSLLSHLFIARLATYDLLTIIVTTKEITYNVIVESISVVLSFYMIGVYKSIWRFASNRDYLKCMIGLIIAGVVYGAISIFMRYDFSRICVCVSFLVTLIGIIGSRAIYTYIYALLTDKRSVHRVRTLIIGGGYSGSKVTSEMLRGDSGYKPVLIVDDDMQKLNRTINGVPVLGRTEDIPKLVEKHRIKNIFFAIPSCSPEDKKRILGVCSETICEVKVIPAVNELMANADLIGQAQVINIEDLLGRDAIKFDNFEVKTMIHDKICMVTGGGGSIGSELCRQIAKFGPKKLVIVDIYENNAYDIEQELLSKYQDINLDVRIASVRDYDKMEVLFDMIRPELVFHAAAHKHVPLMETSPEEAIKNNVGGTYNVAYLANKYKAKKFVLVSTDKAVNPTNVMGATKRCCEMITEYFAQISGYTEFVAVRFGNVLGSNGSVIPLFEKQIASGGPVTVTHPDIIRYFMTIPEAVSLILQAGTMAKGGEIFVLDMGEPVKILDLAENLIRLHGKEPYADIDIEFTGLRPGEKLFEELLMSEEGIRETANKKIFIGTQIQIDEKTFESTIEEIKRIAYMNDSDEAVEALRKVVPTFNHVVINK